MNKGKHAYNEEAYDEEASYKNGYREEEDMVNHPPHYNWHPKGIECIDIVEWMKSPNLANVIKYVWRADGCYKFDDIEDLRKAEWYLKREIARRTGESK